MDPSQVYSAAYLAEDHGWELVKIVITFAVLTTVFMSLFLVSRTLNKTLNGLDVYLMPPAYIFCFGNIIVSSLLVKYGGSGRHLVALSPETFVVWLKLDLAEQLIYMFSITFPKLAILCLYERIFTTRFYRRSIVFTAVIIISTLIGSLVSSFLSCKPFAFTWNKTIPGGKCDNQMASYRYISIPNLLTDVLILVLPLHVVWCLQMGIAQKLGLSVTFMTGCIGIITSIVRFVSFFQTDLLKDPTYFSVKTMTWTIIEPSVYFIAATLPSLRPLIRRVFKDVDFGSFYMRLQSYYVRVFSTQRETDNISLTGVYGGPRMTSVTAKAGANSGTSSIGFKRLDESGKHKSMHTYRERYEHEDSEQKV